MRRLARFAAAVLFAACAAAGPARADSGFDRWVANFWPVAHDAGITRPVFDAAFRGVTPDPEVIEKANSQAEFVKPLWEYIGTVVSEKRIATGRTMLQQYKSVLDGIEARYGVDRYTLVAIWGIESSYGDALDDPNKIKSVVRSLATLAYADPSRAKFGRQQLVATLKILQRGDVSLKGLTGSWAGAMGHTQFIPTTYNGFAVDYDGDGRRNIWTSPVDALASSANYLEKSGWVSGKTWGYEVEVPPGLKASGARTLADWQKLGVRRAGSGGFPRGADRATLVLGGDGGPAFLMLKNHYVIRRYNDALAYALAVGHLADRLRGGGDFVHPWPQAASLLSEEQSREVQQHLARGGYYQGEIDGAMGPESRAAIRAYQQERGLAADGRPDVDLLKILRGG